MAVKSSINTENGQMASTEAIFSSMYTCDWLRENLPVMHKDKYLEIHNLIIQSVISQEALKSQACNCHRSIAI